MPDKILDTVDANADANAPQQPPLPPLPPAIEGHEDSEGGDGKRHYSHVGENTKKPKHWTAYVEAACAVLLVVITGTYTYYASQQTRASITAANAASQAAGVAISTLDEAKQNNIHQAALAEQARLDAKAASDASNTNSTAVLQATIDQFHQDQRAWVGPIAAFPPMYLVDGRQVYIKVGEKPLFGFSISNSGKTPARNLTAIIAGHAYPSTQKFAPYYLPKPKNPGTVGMLFPGIKMDVPTDPNTDVADTFHTGLLTSGKSIFYIYGKISYSDVFNKPHTTRFCSYVDKDLESLTMCNTYNDAN